MSKRFAYAIDRRYLPLLVPFGLRGSKDGVTLTDDGLLSATFGFFKIETPLANVTEAHITRNYRWWTAFGVRGSMVDDGLSFGTNHNAGVCIHFAEKVPSPLRRSGHSALTVTVADLEGLTDALAAGDGEASSAPRNEPQRPTTRRILRRVGPGLVNEQPIDRDWPVRSQSAALARALLPALSTATCTRITKPPTRQPTHRGADGCLPEHRTARRPRQADHRDAGQRPAGRG